MTTTLSIDPIVLLSYDREYCVVRASQKDDFRPSVGGVRWYSSIGHALDGAQYVAVDTGCASIKSAIKSGAVPVKWDRDAGGWVAAG
jgi:hypothetical protein